MTAPINQAPSNAETLDDSVAKYEGQKDSKRAAKKAMEDAVKVLPAVSDEEVARQHNRRLAIKLGRAGFKVFPNVEKYPQTVCWQHDGDAMTSADREKHNADLRTRNEKEGKSFFPKPAHHIGSTSDANKIRRLWDEFPDATPSISLGISGLFVTDADVDRAGKNGDREPCDGPGMLAKLFEENGFDPASTFSTTSRAGGKHYYFANPLGLRNSGAMKKSVNCDLKGDGGYVVAPGSIRISDGKRYGGSASPDALIASVKKGLPDVPAFIASKIGTASQKATNVDGVERRDGDPEQALEIVDLERALRDMGVSDTLPETSCGEYDVAGLIAKHAVGEWRIVEGRDDSQSAVRWRFIQRMRGTYPAMTAMEGLAICSQSSESAGQYIGLRARVGEERGVFNLATFCRDWVRAGTGYQPPSDGGFDAVNDEPDIDPISDVDLEILYGDAATPLAQLVEKHAEARAKEKEKSQSKKTPKFGIRRSNDIARDYVPIRWLADQAIPMKSITMLFGDSNVGKTFLALHLANCARRGVPFLGRETRQCDVLYLFGEGAEGLSGRVKAYVDSHEPSDLDIAIAVRVPNLFADPGAADKVIAMAKLAFESSGSKIGLIVIDTLQVASSGSNISEQKDMNLVFEKLRRLIDELDVAVVITHHGSKADPKNMRGSLTLRESADAVWFVEQKEAGLSLSPDKLRDASKDKNAMSARLEVVQIGVDENGKPITSCVVRPLNEGSNGKGFGDTTGGDDNPVPHFKVPDDLAGRAAALVEVMHETARNEQPHDPPNKVLFRAPDLMMRMNRWRAERKGLDGELLEPLSRQQFWRTVESAEEQVSVEAGGKAHGRASRIRLK